MFNLPRLRLSAAIVAFTFVAAGWDGEAQSQRHRSPMAELWTEPGVRDARIGPPFKGHRPEPDAAYDVVQRDTGGFSITYRVKDARGADWSVKIGPEAQPEVVMSRILWMMGYHQPPMYFVQRWTGIEDGEKVTHGGARFRPRDVPIEGKGPWQWRDNPFVGTRPLNGLLVLLLLLNSTDLKDDNNELYELAVPQNGVRRWYVVQDLGASLGETGRIEPRRGYILGFEREPFFEADTPASAVAEDGRIQFAFGGRHQDLLRGISVEDVRWMSKRVLNVREREWRAAFAAGGYDAATTARYIARMRAKAREGLALK